MTWWVARAWKRVHEKHQDLIVKTFRYVGLSLNPDSSEDSDLKIKGLPDIAVGDWRLPISSPNSPDNPEILPEDEVNESTEVRMMGTFIQQRNLRIVSKTWS